MQRPAPRAATPQQQGGPSIEKDSRIEAEAERPEARFHLPRLTIEQAGEHAESAWAKCAGEGRSEVEQGAEQDVGEQQIGLGAPQRRMRKAHRLDYGDARLNAVGTNILGSDGNGNW